MTPVSSSEWTKTKRTAIRWLTFLVPVLFSLAGVVYISMRSDLEETYVFQGYFIAWVALVVPLAISILAAFIAQEEELAGNFTGCLSTSVPRRSLYAGKFWTLSLCNTVSAVITLIVFRIGMSIASPGTVKGQVMFIFAIILELFGTLPLTALHLWLSFSWGTGASIGIGMGGLMTATIIGTTVLSDRVWMFISQAWPFRLAKLLGTYLEFTAGVNMSPAEISSGAVSQQLIIGTATILICLIACYVGRVIWFDKREGRKHYE